MKHEGVVKWFNETKGYGFIGPDEGVPMSPRTVRRLRRFLGRCLNWLEERYCLTCGKHLVRYRDGSWDCPDLTKQEKSRRGGITA